MILNGIRVTGVEILRPTAYERGITDLGMVFICLGDDHNFNHIAISVNPPARATNQRRHVCNGITWIWARMRRKYAREERRLVLLWIV